MFYKTGKIRTSANLSFSKNGKFSNVPALKDILTGPALGFFFGSVLHQLQFNISSIACNLVETVLA